MSDAGPIARVAVDVAAAGVDHPLSYRVPPALAGRLRLGHRVLVPLGRRRVQGFVLGFADAPGVTEERLRDVLAVLDEEPLLTPDLAELALWLKERTLCRLAQALRAILPPPARAGTRARASLAVAPAQPPEALRAEAERLARRAPARAALLRALAEVAAAGEAPLPAAELLRRAGASAAALRALLAAGWACAAAEARRRDPYPAAAFAPRPPLPLTPDQERALAPVAAALAAGRGGVFYLHGVTGSGKTEVYLHAIARALAAGRRALLLVPEISLTPQLVERCKAALGDRVAVLHSALSEAERRDEWFRIRRGQVDAVVGARSAVFAPLPDLGLIVLDEEHEPSYKQDEAPRYHAREVALERARRLGAVCLLGSATPSLEMVQAARAGATVWLRLPRRVLDRPPPAIRVVDMRREPRRGLRALLSGALQEALAERLRRGEQALLFLNRRGYAAFVLCRECGHVVRCRRCSVSLTLHQDEGVLRCHYCDHREPPPARCPACRGAAVGALGVGTERVEEAVRRLFPTARVARLDADVAARRGAHERVYRAFRAGEVDVLVGTQMVAKGWDVPGVTLVGVVSADTALHLPDFRSAERTYQLLVQVAGRAGRGDRPGEVIVQTYDPEHPAIAAAVAGAERAFYRRELALRRAFGYPPFVTLVRLVVSGGEEARVVAAARALAEALRAEGLGGGLLGPAPAPLHRLRGRWRWQLAARGDDGDALRAAVRAAVARWEPAWARRVQLAVDVDPVHML